MKIMMIIFGIVLGAALGSFACCQAWRIRLEAEGKKSPGKRSVCLHCKKKLEWYENIPIVSWLAQGGKCRKCGKKIGNAELIAEIGGAIAGGMLAWKMSGAETWGAIEIVKTIIVAIYMTVLMILAVYDAKWGELPVKILVIANALGVIYAGIGIATGKITVVGAMETVGLLAGTYYLLYLFSNEKLVGGGDWILCLAIALVLGDPWLAVWVLFLSNAIGAVVMIPKKKKKIPFGPFLVVAFVIVFTLSEVLLKYV